MSNIPLTVVIPTRDEERNLHPTLDSVVGWARKVIVYDSFSEDRTVGIARSYGVEVVQRSFDTFASHKNWILDSFVFETEWVLFIDADERLTESLRHELESILRVPTLMDGYYIARKNYFMNAWVRHAGMYPDWQLRLFKHKLGRYENRAVHEHVLLTGRAGYLKNPLEHNDFKGLARWFERHNKYTSMEAHEILRLMRPGANGRIKPTLTTPGPERTRLVKELAYKYLPCRGGLVFIWMYLLRRGFLDGRIGFRYCLLKAFVDYQTSLKAIELKTVQRMSEAEAAAAKAAKAANEGTVI